MTKNRVGLFAYDTEAKIYKEGVEVSESTERDGYASDGGTVVSGPESEDEEDSDSD